MDKLNSIITDVFDVCGYYGLLLLVVVLVCLYVEARYILNNFKVVKFQGWQSKGSDSEAVPTISVVVPLFGEDNRFVTEHLPLLLNQKGVEYEVVVIYVGNDSEFFDDMESLKHQYTNISFTRIELKSRFSISVKSALNIGIKAAKYDNILFTIPEALPASDMWLSLMASGLKRADVALGYCGVESKKGFANTFVRSYRLTQSLEWLTAAVCERGYRGIRSNIAFRRELYFMAGGFNHLRLNVGLDDLFFQMLIRGRNTEVVLSPQASVTERAWGGVNWLTDQYTLYNASFKFYAKKIKRYVRGERWARVLLFGSAIISVFILPWQVALSIFILLLIKWWMQIILIKSLSKRVGEEKLASTFPIYDILGLASGYCAPLDKASS